MATNFSEGVWYPQGGVYQIAMALESLAEELGVRSVHPELAHHKILFSRDYPKEFDDTFRLGIPPGDPTVNILISSKSDPKHVKGLYYAGGTTHPGGGVPMVILSGKLAAEMVLQDRGQSFKS